MSKQNLQFYLNTLKKSGLIKKSAYKTWHITEKGNDYNLWQQVKVKVKNKHKKIMTTPPPSLPMDIKSAKKDISNEFMTAIKEGIEKSRKGDYSAFPNELSWDSMTTSKKTIKKAWRPNNLRRELEVRELDDSDRKRLLSTIQRANMQERTKVISIKKYTPKVSIQIGKIKITAMWCQTQRNGIKKIYELEAHNDKEIDDWVDNKIKEIEKDLDKSLDEISSILKKKIPFKKPIWARFEHGIKFAHILKHIPQDLIVHDTCFKKVYKDEIEIFGGKGKNPVASLKTFMHNETLIDFTPEIAKEMSLLRQQIDLIFNPIVKSLKEQAESTSFLAENINTHIPVLMKFGNETERMGNILERFEKSANNLKYSEISSIDSIKPQIKSISDFLKPEIREKIEKLSAKDKEELGNWSFTLQNNQF